MKSKGLKVFLWLICSVLFSLLPIAINYIDGRANGRPPGWIDLLAGGEYCASFAAPGVRYC
ncbi:MAG: hypothetical protein ABSG65_07490 [Bryobacteraceae bacterium]|jgi:hypothetical protein